jgi:hypothetical protein
VTSTRPIVRITFAAAAGLLSLACSGGSLDDSGPGGTGGALTGEGPGNGGQGGTGGTTGPGGTTGTGGTMGPGGTTGTGGTGGAAKLDLPDCVQALVAACPTTLFCVVATTDGGFASDICFQSGVRATFSGNITGTGSGPKVVQVTKADGSPCYSMETSLFGGEVYRYVWKDAGGQTVATGSYDPFGNPTHTISCAGGGQTRTCHAPPVSGGGGCCSLNELGNATCTAPPPCAAGICP